jgi:hypothetical protein
MRSERLVRARRERAASKRETGFAGWELRADSALLGAAAVMRILLAAL